MTKKVKVLILCPSLTEKGGVANYYFLVNKHFRSSKVAIDFYFTGRQACVAGQIRVFKTLSDVFKLAVVFPHYDLIVLNPSLDLRAVVRDGFFHFVAKFFFRKKTLVFFRGWPPEFEKVIDRYFKYIFRLVFCFDKGLVLSREFKKTLVRWGFDSETIGLETTTFEQHSLPFEKNPHNIIFLSRLVEGKGCLEAVKTVKILAKDFPEIKLFIVGDGELLSVLNEYVQHHNLRGNIIFTGWLEGDDKYFLLNKCGIMLLPSHSEGMPNSILEGMGMGLAIVSRPVGGIPEVIMDGQNGFLVPTLSPIDFAEKTKILLTNFHLWKSISETNSKIAREKFEVNSVVKRLEHLFAKVVS